jgi:TRAP-type uncharacterized transport system substrate-binding protein
MFAYCGNNPANRADPSGNAFVHIGFGFDTMDLLCPALGGSSGGGCAYALGTAGRLAKFVNNESEVETLQNLENYGVSFYKGALVVKTPFDASFSFGIIGLSENQQNVDTLNHEYGHVLQMKDKGLDAFIIDVAVPSVMINILDRKGKLKYDYFGAPWEAEADALGGVNRVTKKTPWPAAAYNSYWDLIKMFWE